MAIHLRESASAHFASKFSGQPNRCRAGEGREQSQADQRITEEMTRDRGNEPDEWRLIDISPIEVFAAGGCAPVLRDRGYSTLTLMPRSFQLGCS